VLCACATVVTLEKLYSRWATDPLFVCWLGHILEKVETLHYPLHEVVKQGRLAYTSYDAAFSNSLKMLTACY